MEHILTHFKMSKASIAPIFTVIVMALMTTFYVTHPYIDKFWMAPYGLVVALAWMFERLHAVWLKHKVHQLEEKLTKLTETQNDN